MEPYQYKKRILLAITGLSPQVVTETLYALAVKQQPAFVPTEIHVMTTAEGYERARLTLLSKEPGWFHRLCKDYGLPEIAFDETHIHVLRDEQGQVLQDIRTPQQNAQVADQLSEMVRKTAQDEEAAMHVSIAGGRKTMGFYLGYALSLYGRPQDRLSHVLVAPGFESHPDFFYPTPNSHVIFAPGPGGRPMDTSRAQVTLADIPFVRLRDGLPEALLKGASSFSETITAAQRMYGPVSVLIDMHNWKLHCGGIEITLPPTDFALYVSMATRVMSGQSAVFWKDEQFKKSFLDAYALRINKNSARFETAEKAVNGIFEEEYFAPHVSKIKSELEKALGKKGAEPYLIRAEGKKNATRYALNMQPDAIRFTGESQSMVNK